MKRLKVKKILTFPEARQSTNFSCGAASIQAILYYYGIDIREDNIIKMLDVKPTSIVHSGIDPDIMKKKLEDIWKLKVLMKQNMTIDNLKKLIDKNIPVILAIQAWQSEDETKGEVDYSETYFDGHYVVAIGYTDKHIIFEDPSILSNRGYLTYGELNDRWHDKDFKNRTYEHLGLAVYGKKPKYKDKIAKKIL